MSRSYDIGSVVRISGTFKDVNRSLADPAAVVFRYRLEDGTTTSLTYLTDVELVRDSLGKYHVDITILTDQYGQWFYRWEGTGGSVTAAFEADFFVYRSHF